MPITIATDGSGGTSPGQPFTVDGTLGAQFLFVPSARLAGPNFGESERKKSRTFARGYKEKVNIVTNSGASWLWRRIVFRYRMLNQLNEFPDSVNPFTHVTFKESTRGQMRPLWNLGDQVPADYQQIRDNLWTLLFEGRSGQDWSNIFTAKIDTRFVKVISDRTRNLGGGNSSAGRFHNRTYWYPVNRTLVYNDSEEGNPPAKSGQFSNLSDDTCGDIVVYDMFTCQAVEGDQLQFGCEGTYFWHEG